MTLHSALLKYAILPLASWRMGNQFSKEYRLLLETQGWPRDRLRELQTERLLKILSHSFETVPFYREWLGDHGLEPSRFREAEDLQNLPVLTKKDIQKEGPDRMVSSALAERDRIPYSTSGSTGEPFRFSVSNRFNGNKIARYFREMTSWGIEPGTPFLKVWGAGRVPTPGQESEKSFFIKFLLRREEVLAFDLDVERAEAILHWMASQRTPVLEAYTSSACFLAKCASAIGLSLPALRTVVVSGETLTHSQETLLRETFDVRVVNAYGSREFGKVAFTAPDDNGLVYSMEDFYAEYLDLDPPDPEGRKRLILTCFSNDAQPFIRYDTGDLVVPASDDDSGIGLERWKQISGRLAEQVTTPAGQHISVHFFTLLLEDLENEVLQFQIVVESPDQLVLLIVPGPEYREEFKGPLQDKIEEHVGEGMEVEIRLVDSIPVTGDGKRPLLRKLV